MHRVSGFKIACALNFTVFRATPFSIIIVNKYKKTERQKTPLIVIFITRGINQGAAALGLG